MANGNYESLEFLNYDGLKRYHAQLTSKVSKEVQASKEEVEAKIQNLSVDETTETLIIK